MKTATTAANTCVEAEQAAPASVQIGDSDRHATAAGALEGHKDARIGEMNGAEGGRTAKAGANPERSGQTYEKIAKFFKSMRDASSATKAEEEAASWMGDRKVGDGQVRDAAKTSELLIDALNYYDFSCSAK